MKRYHLGHWLICKAKKRKRKGRTVELQETAHTNSSVFWGVDEGHRRFFFFSSSHLACGRSCLCISMEREGVVWPVSWNHHDYNEELQQKGERRPWCEGSFSFFFSPSALELSIRLSSPSVSDVRGSREHGGPLWFLLLSTFNFSSFFFLLLLLFAADATLRGATCRLSLSLERRSPV